MYLPMAWFENVSHCFSPSQSRLTLPYARMESVFLWAYYVVVHPSDVIIYSCWWECTGADPCKMMWAGLGIVGVTAETAIQPKQFGMVS